MIAGHKATAFSAFKTASKHFKSAVKLLPDDYWQSHHELALDLFASAAEAEYALHDFKSMKEFCDKILNEHSVSPANKLKISHVLIDACVADHKPGESIKIAISMLKDCGVKISQDKLRIRLSAAFGLLRIKLSKKMQYSDTIAKIAPAQNKTDTEIMKTLDHLATAAYVGKPELFPLVVLQSIQYTFDHGITVYSLASFAMVGLLLACFMGDPASGRKFAEKGLAILQRVNCKEVESRTIFVAYIFSEQWMTMKDCMKYLFQGYEVGLSTGDLISAMYCAHFWCEYAFYTGMPLADVDTNMTNYGEQMEDFGQLSILSVLKMVHQAVRILRGLAGHINGTGAVLSGDIMDQEDVLRELSATKAEFLKMALQRYRPILACYVGDYENGAALAMKWTDKCCKMLPGQPAEVIVRFCSALCCYAMARKTRNRRYIYEAKRHHQFLRRWSKRPKATLNPNCVHREVLLSAELDAVSGKIASAFKKFEHAITMAGRCGIVQDQALANERYADLCLEQGDQEDYYFRINAAVYGMGGLCKSRQVKGRFGPFSSWRSSSNPQFIKGYPVHSIVQADGPDFG